ncbi:MAG: PLP-dependent aminotransferase family protein [Actinomycetota bacterium]
MAQFPIDAFADRYAKRTAGMSASEIRALFAVASRPEVISFAGGMPFVEALPGEEVLRVVRGVLERRSAEALQYCAGGGLPVLKERLVSVMAEEGVDASPEHIVVTEGAQQALDLLGKIFLDPGDEIAVEAPSYVGALSAFSAYEPRFVSVPLDDDGLVVEALEEALVRGARPKFLYTVPNFHNPAGVTLSEERRRRLVALCREAGVLIIEDNPYGMLRFEGPAPPTLRSLDPRNVIYVGTVSKIFSPAVRIGWALAEPGVIQRLVLAKEAADLCSSAFTQVVAEEWFTADWKAPLSHLVEIYRSRRDAMLGALTRHFPVGTSWTNPAGGFYVWVTLPSYLDSSAMLAAAVERRVAYVPGTGFYSDGEGRDRLRLAFCYPPEADIEEGIRRLGELLADEVDLYRTMSGSAG